MDTIFNGVNAFAALVGAIVPIVLWLLDRRRLLRRFEDNRASSASEKSKGFTPPRQDRWRTGKVKFADASGKFYYLMPEETDKDLGDDVSLSAATLRYKKIGSLKAGDRVRFKVFKPVATDIEKI